jgi:SulP family sulfate permease
VKAQFEPKLFSVLRQGYSGRDLLRDAVAGVLVGVVALPLAIAFAIASGVKPEQGLYTAIVAGLVISALGGSRTQISGPTGAFIVIVYGIVHEYGYEGLAVATFVAGILLILMGLARVGALVSYVPYPVTVGFTSGIALIIFCSQVRDFCGLEIESLPADFVDKVVVYSEHIGATNWTATGIGVLSLVIIAVWPRVTNKVPGPLVAIVVATVLVEGFDLPVATIASRFGEVPSDIPAPHMPAISLALVRETFSPAVTIALLAALESLLSAVVADGMLGTRHRANVELMAQGVGNVLSPLFMGIPATGAIARTATNIKSGGRTPVAGIVHGITLLLIVLFAGRWAALIPMPALAAILVVVAYNMSEWRTFRSLLQSPRSDVAVLLVTFALTVLIDLTVAVQVGVVLAAFMFLKRMAQVTQVVHITEELEEEAQETYGSPRSIDRRFVPEGVQVFEVQGSLFFAAVERFKDTLRAIEQRPAVLVIRMRDVLSIDATGLQGLDEIRRDAEREGTVLLLTGIHSQTLAAMENAGFLDRLGRENVLEDIDAALRRASFLIDPEATLPSPRPRGRRTAKLR